ncbi:ImmA/IrrE family metallo-endopeptidase [Kitasatospora sp. MBT63]|uniref:ImmA/IrrE family metallo-endopeptidase n=1 Tax=Kitasatospora sp. MBT63 TaxID=1444768 RepID=UPI0009E666F7|nr:ImmA/IrrE family metallo-endopeptidase [Kitasatospora sp. MBT63]
MTEKTRWSLDQHDFRSFNPSRLTLARERRALTKQGLAQMCGVTRRTVTAWESGDVDSPPLAQISAALDVPPEFFLADDAPLIDESGVSFRALSSVSSRQITRVLAISSLAIELAAWIDKHYGTPAVDLPDLSESSDLPPALAAEQLRSIWGLHHRPIKNMVTLLERKGVRVFSLPIDDRDVDAFEFSFEGRPFVFLNTSKSAERMRFDLAHELGHIILHKGERKNLSRQIEQEAHEFAASFLVPADELHAQVVGKLRLDDIFKLKSYWKVSAVAMVERLYQLEFITEWTRRQWMIDLSQRGFRSSEPGGITPEGSRLLSELFRIAREDGWSAKAIAASLCENPKDLDSLVFGLAISALPGGGQAAPPVSGHLSLVR